MPEFEMYLLAVPIAARGASGLTRYLIHRTILHGLLRSGGWVLVLIVVAVMVAFWAWQTTHRPG